MTAGGYDTGYATPETSLSAGYGESPLQPSSNGLFGTGGYAL